jgi:NADPH:quinone reductase-like Zn-dependent oxidoreductase
VRAAVYTKGKSGKILEMKDLEQPVPKDNEVLIRVHAASVNPLDWRMKKQRPGIDVAGQVIAVATKDAFSRSEWQVCHGRSSQETVRGVYPIAQRIRAVTIVEAEVHFFVANLNRDDLMNLCGLITAGKVTPVIDRRYLLSETASAIAYVEEGHARAKVVITLQ